jgi:hypothetical protein
LKEIRIVNIQTDLTGWKKPGSPALNLLHANIKTRADHPTLVEPAVQFNHNLTRSVVINILKLANVAYSKDQQSQIHTLRQQQIDFTSEWELTVALHDDKELDDHFGRGPDHNLSLPTLLCIVHALQCIIKDADPHHPCLTCKYTVQQNFKTTIHYKWYKQKDRISIGR